MFGKVARWSCARRLCYESPMPFSVKLRSTAALGLMCFVAPAAVWWAGRSAAPPDARSVLAKMRGQMIDVPPARVFVGSREPGAAERPREVNMNGFRMGRYEVTVEQYACYLNAMGIERAACPDLVRQAGWWRPRWGRALRPVTHVSRDDAERFCEWLSGVWQQRVRLPSGAEWERAARGGVDGARYPWGWGEAAGRARFGADGPCRVGRYAPNPMGFYDMAGNVFEWCAENGQNDCGMARGGSWAERDPATLRVFACVALRPDYRDRDVGFRVLMEAVKIGEENKMP